VTDDMERVLMEALQAKRPVLINPTDDEIHAAADGLRLQGKLICTACRQTINEIEFESERVSFSPKLQAVAHLHTECAGGFRTKMTDDSMPMA